MSITLGDRSQKSLAGVHPDLVRVVRRAAAMASKAQDFTVLEGLRSKEKMAINYGKGRTAAECAAKGVAAKYAQPKAAKVTWLNNPFKSNHGAQADGFGHAVDIVPYPIDWNDLARFRTLAALMKAAAHSEGVAIVAGADWSKKDWPHFELVS